MREIIVSVMYQHNVPSLKYKIRQNFHVFASPQSRVMYVVKGEAFIVDFCLRNCKLVTHQLINRQNFEVGDEGVV